MTNVNLEEVILLFLHSLLCTVRRQLLHDTCVAMQEFTILP